MFCLAFPHTQQQLMEKPEAQSRGPSTGCREDTVANAQCALMSRTCLQLRPVPQRQVSRAVHDGDSGRVGQGHRICMVRHSRVRRSRSTAHVAAPLLPQL